MNRIGRGTKDEKSVLTELRERIGSDHMAYWVAWKYAPDLLPKKYATFNELKDILGLVYAQEDDSIDEEVEKLIAERTQARKNKDWATADRIRDQLKEMNIVVEDTPQGIKWHKA